MSFIQIRLERIWSAAREEHNVVPANFPSRESFQQELTDVIRRDKYLGNLGSTGRQQVIDRAMQDWEQIPTEERIEPLMVMRERGLLSRDEFYQLAHEMGYSDYQAENQYRKWTGTEEAIWGMKWRGLLRRGEYTRLYRASGMTKGSAWYRYRSYLHRSNIRPFVRTRRQPRVRRRPVRG